MKVYNLILVLSFTFFSCSKKTTQISKIEVAPKGEYAKIDIESQNKILEDLNSGDTEKSGKAANKILNNPNLFFPPALYSLSNYLFQNDKKNEAAFWFYTGQLRARYDANRCNDETAAQAVSILNDAFGYQINQYSFSDLNNLKGIVERVVKYVGENEEQYDNQWINLHGMGAFLNEDKPLSKPKSEWSTIKQRTIDDYYKGFTEAVESMKNK